MYIDDNITNIYTINNLKLFYHFDLVLLKNAPSKFSGKVDDFHRTDDGEPSEKSHGASNCRQHVHKLCCSVLLYSVKRWGGEVDPHESQVVFPLIIFYQS